jgi:hypothetical protein
MTLAFEKAIEQNRDGIRVLFQYGYGIRRLLDRIRGFGRPGPGEPPPPESGGGGQGGATIQREDDGGENVSPNTEGRDVTPNTEGRDVRPQ